MPYVQKELKGLFWVSREANFASSKQNKLNNLKLWQQVQRQLVPIKRTV